MGNAVHQQSEILFAVAQVRSILSIRRIICPKPGHPGSDGLFAAAHELSFTIGGVLAILTAGALVILAPVALQSIGMETQTELLVRFGRWTALAILLLLALALLYRYGPSRRSPKWRWISVGSVTATLTWMAGSGLLSYYLSNFGHYDATYGSLGAAIALMMWMWMTTIVILFGAELNSEIEHQTLADSTTGAPKPLGDRGARMADTVVASYS
jgi:membrane protein